MRNIIQTCLKNVKYHCKILRISTLSRLLKVLLTIILWVHIFTYSASASNLRFGISANVALPVGDFSQEDKGNAGAGFGSIVYLGYRLTTKTEIGAQFGIISFNQENGDIDMYTMIANCRYYYFDSEKSHPFLLIGFGNTQQSTSSFYIDHGSNDVITSYCYSIGMGSEYSQLNIVYLDIGISFHSVFTKGEHIAYNHKVEYNSNYLALTIGFKF